MIASVWLKCRHGLAILLASGLLIACSPDRLSGNNTELSGLTIDGADLDQYFQGNLTYYTASIGYLGKSARVTPVLEDGNASVTVNGIASAAQGVRVALAEGANNITVVVTAANGRDRQTYNLTITRDTLAAFAEDAYAKSLNTQNGDQFGFSVAVDGDLLAVGAPYEDSGVAGINNTPDESATDSGAVYVFLRTQGTWIPDAYIKASNPGNGDRFGFSVALSGDTLAVGAYMEDSNSTDVNSTPNDDGNADNSGAAYVFVRDNDGYWNQQAYIKPSNTGAGDYFGFSVAVNGDTLSVGAYGEDSNSTDINSTPNDDGNADNSGAVYVFVRDSSNNWGQQAYIKASNTGAGDYFGLSVAVDGNSLAVGAYSEDSNSSGIDSTPNDDGSADNSGAVYVFVRDSSNNWGQQAYIKASNPGATDGFGVDLDISEDTLVVGAAGEDSNSFGIDTIPNDDGNANNSGAVYVFVRDANDSWDQQAYIKANLSGTTNANDQFGGSVAIDGDSLAVGAYLEDSSSIGINSTANDDGSANNSGAVYVFTRDGNTWNQYLYLKSPFTEAGDNYGVIYNGVAISGDLLAVGLPGEDSDSYGINDAYYDDGFADSSGAVYVYE